MKRLGIFLTATLGLAGLAQAADLPTQKADMQTPRKPNCWASFWDWLNSSANDCPLSYAGIILCGTLNVGAGYFSQGAVAAGWGRFMKRLGMVFLATVGLASLARAADLPTTKGPAAAPSPNCFASLWTY